VRKILWSWSGWLTVALAAVLLLAASLCSPPGRVARAQSNGGDYIPLINAWNVSSVSSGSPVLGANVIPRRGASVLRIAVVLGSSVPLAIYFTDGTTSFTCPLNGGTALTAGCAYTFVMESRCVKPYGSVGGSGGIAGTPSALNFVVQGPTTVPLLWVSELNSGAD
jgi:hypothetical protein